MICSEGIIYPCGPSTMVLFAKYQVGCPLWATIHQWATKTVWYWLEICETGYDEKQKLYDIVGSEEVFPLNPDSADLCAIARAKSPKTNQGENMPPGGIIVKNDDDDANVDDKDIIVKNDDDKDIDDVDDNIGWLQR